MLVVALINYVMISFAYLLIVVGVGGLLLMLDAAVIHLSCTVHIIKQQELLVI